MGEGEGEWWKQTESLSQLKLKVITAISAAFVQLREKSIGVPHELFDVAEERVKAAITESRATEMEGLFDVATSKFLTEMLRIFTFEEDADMANENFKKALALHLSS
jgi:hypothetical protein